MKILMEVNVYILNILGIDEKINLLGKFWTIIGGRNNGKNQKNMKVNVMGARFGNMIQELYEHQLWNIEHQQLKF
jgi:hypothetical protein